MLGRREEGRSHAAQPAACRGGCGLDTQSLPDREPGPGPPRTRPVERNRGLQTMPGEQGGGPGLTSAVGPARGESSGCGPAPSEQGASSCIAWAPAPLLVLWARCTRPPGRPGLQDPMGPRSCLTLGPCQFLAGWDAHPHGLPSTRVTPAPATSTARQTRFGR